jgi:hypothetical protein
MDFHTAVEWHGVDSGGGDGDRGREKESQFESEI